MPEIDHGVSFVPLGDIASVIRTKEPRRREKRGAPGLQRDRRLFRHGHEQSARQVAVRTNHGCIVGVIVLAKKGRRAVVGLFL